MSKSVMLSIQPKWCELIASGKKTIEVRKTKPKIDVPFKCYIYCTKGSVGLYKNGDCITAEKISVIRVIPNLSGKVIGEFVCDKIYNLVQFGGGISFADEKLKQLKPQLFRDMSCLTDEQTETYLNCKDGYGWHISNLSIYDKPKELSVFWKADICKHYDGGCDCLSELCKTAKSNDCHCGHAALTRPPQSWCYVMEG